jgi:hypothetical protein
MFRWAVVLAMIALLVTGALVAWPQVRGFWLYERTEARILDVIPTVLADGRVQLAIAYEVRRPPAPGSSDRVREWQISWTVADAWFRPMADPIVAASDAEAAIDRWLDAGQAGRRLRVAYRLPQREGAATVSADTVSANTTAANDHDDATFILDETSTATAGRVQLGTSLIGVGLVLALWLLRRNR